MITFIKGSETSTVYSCVMHKHIFSIFLFNKSKPFCVIKPFYDTFGHIGNLLYKKIKITGFLQASDQPKTLKKPSATAYQQHR